MRNYSKKLKDLSHKLFVLYAEEEDLEKSKELFNIYEEVMSMSVECEIDDEVVKWEQITRHI